MSGSRRGLRKRRIAKFLLFVINFFGTVVVFVVMAWQIHILNGGVLPTMAETISMPGVPKPNMNPMTSALLMMKGVGREIAILMQAVSMIMDTPLGERSERTRLGDGARDAQGVWRGYDWKIRKLARSAKG